MNSHQYKIFNDKTELAHNFAQLLEQLTQQQSVVYLAISGGSTPQHIFDVMALHYSKTIQWNKIILFWVDERCVLPTDIESNYAMTNNHLLKKVGLLPQNIFRVITELPVKEALEDYISKITLNVPHINGIPQFDITILGMGDDGHTASIFPHEIELWQSPNICEIGHHPVTGQQRVTLTGKVINQSKQIIFLVTGNNKAEKIQDIFLKSNKAANYPASLVSQEQTTWLLDKEAAQLIQ